MLSNFEDKGVNYQGLKPLKYTIYELLPCYLVNIVNIR